MSHTPTPVRLGDAGMTIFGPKTDRPSPLTIARLQKAEYGPDIVRAINAYESHQETLDALKKHIIIQQERNTALVEALKGITKEFKRLSETYEPDDIGAEWLAHAHAALAAAEKGASV